MPTGAHLIAAMTDAGYGSPSMLTGRRRSWRTEVESWVIAIWKV
jgi:hypothetical protein